MPSNKAMLYGEDPDDLSLIDSERVAALPPVPSSPGKTAKKSLEKDDNCQIELEDAQEQLTVYQTIFRECPLPLICIDSKTKLIDYWNNSASLKFGISRTEAIGSGLDIIFAPGQMSPSQHDVIVDNFINSAKSRSAFGTSRILKAMSRSNQVFIIKIFTFKIDLDDRLIVGAAIVDETKQKALVEKLEQANQQMTDAQSELKSNNETLKTFNASLLEAKQAAEFRMARAKSQNDITNRLMIFIVVIIVCTVALSAFTRIPETILSFVKDSCLLLLGILSGAVGGIFGGKDNQERGNTDNSTIYQGPIIPTVPMPGETGSNYSTQSYQPSAQPSIQSSAVVKPQSMGGVGARNLPPSDAYVETDPNF